jgi:cytochrome P450
MLRPLFSLNRANIFTQVEEHTEHLVGCIPTAEIIDLQPLFFQFTFDTTTYLLFGKSMNSLQANSTQHAASAREAEFAESFRISQDYLFRRGRLGDLYWLIDNRDFRRHCSIVHKFIDEAVQEALSAEYQDSKSADMHSFLDALIKETRDPRVLRDQLLNVMLAGRDTTACCLTWTLYVIVWLTLHAGLLAKSIHSRLLAQHPHVLEKLREEISSVAGVGEDSRLPNRNLLRRMKYLTLVLKEGILRSPQESIRRLTLSAVLRLYPSVPINSRTAIETTTIPTGGGPGGTQPLMIRKGEAVGYSVYAMHRLKKLYGEDADSFRPERWDPDVDNAVDLKNIGWGYLPFNGGPRLCLGRKCFPRGVLAYASKTNPCTEDFGLLEAGYVTVRILQKFRSFELDSRDARIAVGAEKQEVTLVVASTDGCRVKAIE